MNTAPVFAPLDQARLFEDRQVLGDLLSALGRLGWKPKPRTRGRVLRRGARELPAPMLADAVLDSDHLGPLAERFDVPYAELCSGLGRGGRTLAAGAIVGAGYRLEARLGRGAHAEVWSARRGGEAVAVKLLRGERAPHLASYVTRFAAEADKLGRVRSAHVPRLRAAGFDADAGTPYIVMDLVHGVTLGALRRGPPLELGRALAVGAAIARALGDLAAVGLVGSDIHPENVMLDTAADDRVTLIDLDRATLEPAPVVAVDLRQLGLLLRGLVPRETAPAALGRLCERLALGHAECPRAVAAALDVLAFEVVARA